MKEAIITSSVLILCIALLRRLCKGRISAGLQYALWLLVAVRLMVPGITAVFPDLLPKSGFSIMNVADKVESAAQKHIPPIALPVQINLPVGLPFLTGVSKDGPTSVFVAGRILWTWIDVIKGIWYFGMAVVGVWMTAVNIRFMHKLLKYRIKYECTENSEKEYKLPIYLVKGLSSPCLYGIPGRLAVYLPESAAEKEKVRHILTHEYCHYKHKDVFWAMLRCVLVTVYWFHPLVWLAAILSKQDCELACDEAAIKALGEEERLAYGKTLVSLITRKTRASDIICAATTMTAGTESMKERVRRIAEKPRRLAAVFISVITVAGIAAAFTFTQSQGKGFPPDAFLLNGGNSLTATTDCFQVTFPDSFSDKAYYRIIGGTDIFVYHKDSNREIGHFSRMTYEDAVKLADTQEVTLIQSYGANDGLQRYIDGGGDVLQMTEHHYYSEPDSTDGITGVPGTDSNGGTAGVSGIDGSGNETEGIPGADSNDNETIYLPEEHIYVPEEYNPSETEEHTFTPKGYSPSETEEHTFTPKEYTPSETQVGSNGGIAPIPAPEEIEFEAEKMPYIEGSDIDSEKERNGEENHKLIPVESVSSLPDEQIAITGIPVDAAFCYLYVPADNANAKESLKAELQQMNRTLVELADSVTVLYMSADAIEEALDVLAENRNPYVGDAVRTSKIAGALPFSSDMSYQHIEMKTDAEPYAITIFCQKHVDNDTPIDSDILFMNAALVFASIENIEQCTIRTLDMQTEYSSLEGTDLNYSAYGYSEINYQRDEMEELFGELYPCSETKDGLIDLYNRVLAYLEEE